jgi:hypothetical protein
MASTGRPRLPLVRCSVLLAGSLLIVATRCFGVCRKFLRTTRRHGLRGEPLVNGTTLRHVPGGASVGVTAKRFVGLRRPKRCEVSTLVIRHAQDDPSIRLQCPGCLTPGILRRHLRRAGKDLRDEAVCHALPRTLGWRDQGTVRAVEWSCPHIEAGGNYCCCHPNSPRHLLEPANDLAQRQARCPFRPGEHAIP